ncbi:DciA family protein [Streptomyces sp. NPDC056500]|uniref:DciA family protein n=1 Tax=Streptomyces sp. NPDC056500 TaxID=3345840 RepID=UPI0036CB99A0
MQWTPSHGRATDPALAALQLARERARSRPWTTVRAASGRESRAASARHRRLDSVSLGDAIRELVHTRGWDSSSLHPIVSCWNEMAGETLTSHLPAVSFDQDTRTLTLQSDSVAWSTQGRLLAPLIVKRLNSELGDDMVRAVRIHKHLASALAVPPALGRGPVEATSPVVPEDPETRATVDRQNAEAVREPRRLFTPPQSTTPAALRADTVRALALRHARSAANSA